MFDTCPPKSYSMWLMISVFRIHKQLAERDKNTFFAKKLFIIIFGCLVLPSRRIIIRFAQRTNEFSHFPIDNGKCVGSSENVFHHKVAGISFDSNMAICFDVIALIGSTDVIALATQTGFRDRNFQVSTK